VSVRRAPLGGILAGTVPGEAEVGEPSDLSHVRNERVPGVEALIAVWFGHTAWAPGHCRPHPKEAHPSQAYSGKDFV